MVYGADRQFTGKVPQVLYIVIKFLYGIRCVTGMLEIGVMA